jgi:hypothetical protein
VDGEARLGVEGEDHRDDNVVRADAPLSLELSKLLGIGRKARLLRSEEHEHAPLWGQLGLKLLEAATEIGLSQRAHGALPFAAICSSSLPSRCDSSNVSISFAVFPISVLSDAASPGVTSPAATASVRAAAGATKSPAALISAGRVDAQVGGKPALRQPCENAGGPKLMAR